MYEFEYFCLKTFSRKSIYTPRREVLLAILAKEGHYSVEIDSVILLECQ